MEGRGGLLAVSAEGSEFPTAVSRPCACLHPRDIKRTPFGCLIKLSLKYFFKYGEAGRAVKHVPQDFTTESRVSRAIVHNALRYLFRNGAHPFGITAPEEGWGEMVIARFGRYITS